MTTCYCDNPNCIAYLAPTIDHICRQCGEKTKQKNLEIKEQTSVDQLPLDKE